MGYDHHGLLVFGQIIFQPFDRAKIQVIGRLIEQKKIGFGQ